MARHEVQQHLGGAWENTWAEETEGGTVPLILDSYAEAAAFLAEFFADCREAVAAGHMTDVPDASEYRIQAVGP